MFIGLVVCGLLVIGVFQLMIQLKPMALSQGMTEADFDQFQDLINFLPIAYIIAGILGLIVTAWFTRYE